MTTEKQIQPSWPTETVYRITRIHPNGRKTVRAEFGTLLEAAQWVKANGMGADRWDPPWF